MARFYGWTHAEMMKLPANIFNQYHAAIEMISNQEMLRQMQVASYPHYTEKGRESVHRKTLKNAYPENSKPKTFDQFIERLQKWQK